MSKTQPNLRRRARYRTGVALGVAGAVAAGAAALALPGTGAAPSTVNFVQEALSVGLDRSREPAVAASRPRSTSAYEQAYGTFLVDLNGDSRLDVYSVNHGQVDHLSGLWLNLGDAGGATAFGQNLYTVALRPDDGYLSSTGWGLGLGPSASVEASCTTGSTACAARMPDLDGDGRVDLYFGGWYGYGLYCRNAGVSSQDSWTGPIMRCRAAPYAERFGDVNGDGRLDIETYDPDVPYDNYAFNLRTLPRVWALNDGTDDPAAWKVEKDAFAFVGEAAPGALLDFNRDGYPDQIDGLPAAANAKGTWGLASAGTRLRLGQPNRTYIEVTSGLEGARDPIAAIEDVNEDGCLDVGVDPSRYRDNQSWYLQDKGADGACTAHFHFVGRAGAELPYYPGFFRYPVDFDNSGLISRAVIVMDGNGNNDGYAGGVHLFRRNTDGSYTALRNYGFSMKKASVNMLSLGDWNGDGLLDFAGVADRTLSDTDKGIALWTNRTLTSNAWLKVRLPGLSGFFRGRAKIEVFEAGRLGEAAALVTPPQTTSTGWHTPSQSYHFGVGARSIVDLRVTFPDGVVVTRAAVAVNGTVDVRSTEGVAPPPVTADSGADASRPTSGGVDAGPPGPALAVSLASVTVTPTINNGASVASVEWSVDDVVKQTVAQAPYGFVLDLAPLATGRHRIRSRVTDTAGRVATSSELVLER